jgi:MFS family permease
MSAYWQKLRLLNRDARLYLASRTLLGLAVRGGVYSVVLNLYLLRLGYGPELIGLVNGASSVMTALLSLPLGALGSRPERRPWSTLQAMLAGLLLDLAGYGAVPLTESLPVAWRTAWLIASQALTGLGMALYLVHSTPYLMRVTGPEERDHAFSVQSALWPLAAFAGSLIGGALPGFWCRVLGLSLDQPAPYRYTLFVGVALLAPCLVPLALARDTGSDPEPVGHAPRSLDPATPVRSPAPLPLALFAPIVAVGVLRIAGESAVRSFYNVYLDVAYGLPPAQIGAWMAVGPLIAAFAAMLSPLVSGRWGRRRTVAGGAVCTGLLLLPLALIPHPLAAGISWFGLTTMVAIVRPPFMVYTQTSVGPRWQALMSGATNLAAGLGSSLIQLTGGYAVAALGYQRFFLFPAALFCLAGVVFGACLKEQTGQGG